MKISIIGGGEMGRALAQGLLLNGKIPANDITISNPHKDKLIDLINEGVKYTSSNTEAVANADIVVIAVKPWMLKEVVWEISPIVKPSQEVCCIVGGVKGEDIIDMFGDRQPEALSIAMPNTAMRLGKSMTFIIKLEGHPEKALTIFNLTGTAKVIEEKLLPAATALASCGIAYAMRYIRAACEGGVELGFRASEAQEIVTKTIEGAAALLNCPGSHPETEIDKVTTPGGLTIKGLNAMEREGFTNAVIEGLKASVK